MATITSSVSGNTTTYTITDQKGNIGTVTAPAYPAAVTTTTGGLLADGQNLLTTLLGLLVTGLRPNVIANTNASFSN